MSRNKPLMLHDPLADLGVEDVAGQGVQEAPAKDGSVLRLEVSLTIGDVGDFYEACHQALDNTGPLALDAGAIEIIDGAGLQMIGACIKEAIEQGREVQWQATSDALVRASQVLGLDESLGLVQAAKS